MDLLLPSLWFFLLGTAFGSFYNVLIDRLPEGKDVIRVRSACAACGTALRWYDLVPVFSFAFLGGRCRYCGEKLSPWYLISELTVGGLFLLAFLRYASSAAALTLAGDLFLWSLLFVVAVMDWQTGMIMDVFSLLIALGGIAFGLLSGRPVLSVLLGGLVGAVCYGLLYFGCRLLLKREGLGAGDVLLLGAAGFWLPWTQVIVTAFLTAYVSLFFILILALREKKIGMKTAFPLGPSICIAVFLMRLSGDRVMGFLSGLLLV